MKAIKTIFYGPGNIRGARIKATTGENTVIVPYDYSGDAHKRAVRALCEKMGWGGRLISGSIVGDRGNVYVFDPAVKHDAPLTIES